MHRDIHLVIPFSRTHLAKKILDAYRSMHILLHPIVFKDLAINFREDWIFPFILPITLAECTSYDLFYYKLNQFILTQPIVDEDYYVVGCDDDLFESNVFGTIQDMDEDIIFISMKQTPLSTLYATPESIKVDFVGAEQYFVKGKVFKHQHYNEASHRADGELAVHYKETIKSIRYEPNLFVIWNHFKPRHWSHI